MNTLASSVIGVVLAGCALQSAPDEQEQRDWLAATCAPLGAPGQIVDLVPILGGHEVAVDLDGNRYYTLDGGGIAKITPTDETVFEFAMGSVFAIDRKGEAFVAGSFSSPITIGGNELVPTGDSDVFVAVLRSTGEVSRVFALGQPGDGLESIAVDRRGRIAVSGRQMGTVVVNPSGHLMFQLSFSGQVAFDSRMNLYVGGAFTGSIDFGGGHVLNADDATDVDAFLVKLDPRGGFLASVQLGDAPLPITGQDNVVISSPQPQIITALAINAQDQIAILGTFPNEMDLFGEILVFTGTFPSGLSLGLFVAELDASLNVMFSEPLPRFYERNPAGDIAIDNNGNVIVSHNTMSEAFFPFAFPVLTKLDTTGSLVWQLGPELSSSRGFGQGVATDACGNVVWADSERAGPIEPAQEFLRTVAR